MSTTTIEPIRNERHPDLFSPAEAAAYLCVEESHMPTLERDFKLARYKVGHRVIYYRRDLDATAYRMVGLDPPPDLIPGPKLRLSKAR